MLEEFLSTSDPVAQRFPNLYFSSSLTVEFLQATFDPWQMLLTVIRHLLSQSSVRSVVCRKL